MAFENENTWYRMSTAGQAEEFHRLYEEAVERVKGTSGGRYPNLIAGKKRWSRAGQFSDTSPTDTRIVLGKFQRGTREDTRAAIAAAKKAFPLWSAMPYQERVAIFQRAANLIAQRKFDLAALLSSENGKNRYEAMADVDESADLIRYYCEQMLEHNGFVTPMLKATPIEQNRSVLRPYGVWGVIAPFNFPIAIAAGMSSAAMITGNTIVFKPSSEAPLIGYRYVEALTESGLPPGVCNYMAGPGSAVGKELVANPDVAGIVFTGSKDVGYASYREFVRKCWKPFIAEMGGKNPVIVTAKADLQKAAEGVGRAAFGYGGQKCSACSRVLVDRSVKKEFLDKLVDWTKKIKVGDPTLRDTYLGPVIHAGKLEEFQRWVRLAQREGKVLAGGPLAEAPELAHGHFVEPTIVDGLPKGSKLYTTELFLPFLVVDDFRTLDEAFARANMVEYGLTAGFFSEDESEVQQFLDRIQAGVIYVNRRSGGSTGAMVGCQPFVGWKMSGTSGKAAGGPYYLQQFMREQSQTKCVEGQT